MKRLVTSTILLFLLTFSTFSGTAFARQPKLGSCPEGSPCPPASYEKTIPKCQKPAAEYLKEAEKYGNTTEYGISHHAATTSIAAARLYDICSKLEQNK